MADDKLMGVAARAVWSCENNIRATQNNIRPTTKDVAESVFTAIDKAGYVVISREPTEAEIEAMAPGIYDRINLFYHSGTLKPWPEALECHRNIALGAARAAHAGLVKANDT